MSTIRLLVVAPASSSANVLAEVQNLLNLPLHVRLLTGAQCTHMTLLDAIDRYRPFDAIHFAAHGTNDSVTLAAGDSLDEAGLLQAVELSGVTLIFLNTLSGVRLAKAVSQATRADCIATITPTNDDKRAAELATAYWRCIASQVQEPVAAFLRTARYDHNTIYVRSLLR